MMFLQDGVRLELGHECRAACQVISACSRRYAAIRSVPELRYSFATGAIFFVFSTSGCISTRYNFTCLARGCTCILLSHGKETGGAGGTKDQDHEFDFDCGSLLGDLAQRLLPGRLRKRRFN